MNEYSYVSSSLKKYTHFEALKAERDEKDFATKIFFLIIKVLTVNKTWLLTSCGKTEAEVRYDVNGAKGQ